MLVVVHKKSITHSEGLLLGSGSDANTKNVHVLSATLKMFIYT